MKPHIWQGSSRRWYVDKSKTSVKVVGLPDGYRTWREAHDAALASLAAEPTA